MRPWRVLGLDPILPGDLGIWIARPSWAYDVFGLVGGDMRIVILVFLAACCMAMKGESANAAGDPDAATGLVAEKCTSCHEVPGYKARFERADLGAPPFEEIAKNPDIYTPARLRAFLRKPHWPMTQFILSPSDIDNILAFIERLR
jgi:cytochrome c553